MIKTARSTTEIRKHTSYTPVENDSSKNLNSVKFNPFINEQEQYCEIQTKYTKHSNWQGPKYDHERCSNK